VTGGPGAQSTVVRQRLTDNQPKAQDALDVLSKVGGFEMAAWLLSFWGLRHDRARCTRWIDREQPLRCWAWEPGAGVQHISSRGNRSVEPGHTVAADALGSSGYLELRLGKETGGRWRCRCWRRRVAFSTKCNVRGSWGGDR